MRYPVDTRDFYDETLLLICKQYHYYHHITKFFYSMFSQCLINHILEENYFLSENLRKKVPQCTFLLKIVDQIKSRMFSCAFPNLFLHIS